MPEAPHFLSDDEWERFCEPKLSLPRRVREILPDRALDSPKRLTVALTELLRTTQRRSEARSAGPWFAWAAVSVKEGDGRSWAAEAAAQALHQSHGHFEVVCLSSNKLSTDSLPLIIEFLGKQRFFRRVERNKLGLEPIRWWKRGGYALLGAVVIALIIALNERSVDLLKGAPQDPLQLLQLGAIGLILTGLTVASNRLVDTLGTRPARDEIKVLRNRIEEMAAHESVAVRNLINDLAKDVGRQRFPRVVVVDDFETLDLITRKVLERYLDRLPPMGGSEFWLLFEAPSGDRLSLRPQSPARTTGFHEIRRFELLPLSAEERAELASAVGNPARATYSTVRAICAPDLSTTRRYVEFLKSAGLKQRTGPDTYGDADLLHFLWLNAQGGFPRLERGFLLSELATEKGLRARLVDGFLRGTKHRKEEFQNALIRLAEALGGTPLLSVDSGRGVSRITVHHEAGLAFDEAREELELAPSGMGHTYWAILWYDKLQSHPLQAFWIRKLGLHLAESDLALIDDPDLYGEALARILEATIYAIRGVLRCCVYERLPELAQQAAIRASEPAVRDPGLRARVRSVLWEAYTLTGSEDALAGYVRLAAPELPPEEEAPSALMTLFSQSMPLQDAERVTLLRALAAGRPSGEREEAICLFASFRAARLAWAAAEASGLRRAGLLRQAGQEGHLAVREAISALTHRLDNLRTEDVLATDLLSLGTALGCLSHQVHAELRVRSVLGFLRSSPVTEAPLNSLESLVDLAETATLLAQELRDDVANTAATDLTRVALARELCCVVLATGGLATRGLSALSPELCDGDLADRLLDTARMSAAALGLDPHELTGLDSLASDRLLQELDGLLEQSSFIWRQFGLLDLALLAQIWRVDLLRSSSETRRGAWQRSAPLRDTLWETRAGIEHAALFGLLSLARLFRETADLRAEFIVQAATTTLDVEFGTELKTDFSLMAIEAAHHVGTDLGRFLDFLLLPSAADGTRPLDRHLERLSSDEAEGEVLQLLNAGSGTRHPDTFRTLFEMISRSLGRERWPPETEERVRILLDYFELKRNLREDGEAPDTAEILNRWAGRRESWTYPGVLSQLLERGRSEPEVIEEALDVIRNASPEASFNSYFFLALNLAELLWRRDEVLSPEEAPTSYLMATIERWETQGSADPNARAYRLLSMICGEEAGVYLDKAAYWGTVKLQRDEAAKLGAYLEQGHFAAIFNYYIDLLSSWGLETAGAQADLVERLHWTDRERGRWLQQWTRRGRAIPAACIGSDVNARISSDFAFLARILFQPPFLQDSGYDGDRERINQASWKAAGALFRKAEFLPALPPSIRDLVLAYAKRFERYTEP